mgnify:CR=1 FL=1
MRCSLRSRIFIAQRSKGRQKHKVSKGRLGGQCSPCASLPPFCTLSHPPAGGRRYSLSLLFCLSLLSTRFCRLDSVDSGLSTRFCRLWFVDSILSTLVCRLIEISPLCRSNVLGKAIAMPTPFARPNYESSKFFRKKCCSAFRIFHEKIFEV